MAVRSRGRTSAFGRCPFAIAVSNDCNDCYKQLLNCCCLSLSLAHSARGPMPQRDALAPPKVSFQPLSTQQEVF
jgi:hypothetical protein